MTNNIQCSIESSTTKIELNSATEGVFLVPELEGLAGLPEIRTTSGVNAGYDGGWTSAQNYDARLITIRGVIANPDVAQVEAKRRAIASLLGQGRKEQLTLRITTEAGNSYAISVRTISCEMALQRVLTIQEFLIQLRADDPLIYDDGASAGTEAILYVQQALGGFEINFGLPLAIGGGAEDTVVQNGEETVYPILKLYGPLHRPTVVNTTTNQQMQLDADLQYTINWSGYQSVTGDYITISDAIEDAPMTLTQLSGNAEQTTYSGKNLFATSDSMWTGQSAGRVTYSATNDDFTFSRPAGADFLVANGALAFKPSTTYTILFDVSQNTMTDAFRLVVNSTCIQSSTLSIPAGATGKFYGKLVTMSSLTQTYDIWFYCNSPGNTLKAKIMLAEGDYTSATFPEYEPYVGGTASPNPDYPQPISVVTGEQTVGVTRKNLFDGSARTLGLPSDTTYVSTTKRLFDLSTYVSGITRNNYYDSSGAVTTTLNSDGSFTITTANAYYGAGFPFRLRAGTYTFSATRSGASSIITMTTYADDGTYLTAQLSGGNALTFTLAEDTNVLLGIMPESVTTITASNIQLELGNQASEFEPYGHSYKINLGGTNLLNLANPSHSTISGLPFTVENNVISINGVPTTGGSVFFDSFQVPSGTYTLSVTYSGYEHTSGGNTAFWIQQSPDNSSWTGLTAVALGSSSPVAVSATLESDKFYRIQFYSPANTNNNYNNAKMALQLEKGSQATHFVPFVTYAYELAKIGTYQDRIYKDEGKWYIEKQVGKVVLDGSEAWTATGGGNGYRIEKADIVLTPANTNAPILSDYFTTATFSSIYNATIDYGIANHNSNHWIVLRDKNWASVSDVATWLSTHNTTVYYALATPTDTEITDETLLSQLNFIASLYGGVNHISLVPSAGAQGEMIVSYATESETVQDVAIIDSQARTITINGQDAYHLKTAESEFLLLAPGENKLYLTSEASDDSGYAEVKFKQGYLSI